MSEENENYKIGDLSSAEMEFLEYPDENIESSKEHDEDFYDLASAIRTGFLLHQKLKKELDDLTPESATKEKLIELMKNISKTSDLVNSLIKETYAFSGVTNTFWRHCSLITYKNYLKGLKSTYLKNFENSTELDFYKHEYLYFLKNTKKLKYNNANTIHNSIKTIYLLEIVEYYKVLDYETEEFLQINNQRKLDFLSNELLNLGYIIQLAKTKKDVFINLIPAPENNDFDKLDETVLTKSQLPEFNLLERYETLKRLGYIQKIHEVTEIKKTKNKLLALTMNCSVDNARKLLDSTYKILDREKNKARQDKIEEEVDGFFRRNDINV